MKAKNQRLPADLEKIIPVLMKDGDVPGLAVALIRDGEVFWHRGFGVKNSETRDLAGDDTVFEAASLSKPVFAYAVLKMVESGKLDLDAPLNKYLPGNYVENDRRIDRITARRVLSHTTGFPNWRPNGKPLEIYFEPGEKFSYSGEGFVYLQKTIEHLSGLPLEDFMRKTVFEPLGMSNSSYVWQDKYDSVKAFAHDSAGAVAGRSKPASANAAASLHTTVADYAKFVAAILQRKGIGEAKVREMLRPQVKVDAACAVCAERKAGKLSSTISWGLGWGLEDTPGGKFFWHWGDNGNVKAYVAASDDSKTGVVILSNSANGLSIAGEIVKNALGGNHTALTWLDYEPYNSPAKTLLRDVLARGEKAFLEYRKRRKKAEETLSEAQINWLGYQLLNRRKYEDAISIFESNVVDFPASANVYDSLGEAYLKAGNFDLAVENYRKTVRLNPGNAKAAEVISRLQNRLRMDASLSENYAGDYQTPFGILSIVKDGERLVGRISGEPEMILLAQSEKEFVAVLEGIRFAFFRNEKGQATHAIISLKSQDIRAEKIK